MKLEFSYIVFVVLVGCSTGEPTVDVATSVQAASGGGSGGGTTPQPTCEAPRCYESNVSAYAIQATSHGLVPAVDVHATANVAGKFTATSREGIAAVTSGATNDTIAVLARSTATTQDGSAIRARASGANGRPLYLRNVPGGWLMVALANGNNLQIDGDGNMRRNGTLLGQRGLPGDDGDDGHDGEAGADGDPGRNGIKSVTFRCGRFNACAGACSGSVVGDAVGTCEVGVGQGGGCRYGGTDGRCCVCASP